METSIQGDGLKCYMGYNVNSLKGVIGEYIDYLGFRLLFFFLGLGSKLLKGDYIGVCRLCRV